MLQVGSAVQEKPPQEEGEVGGEVGGLSRTELGRTELPRAQHAQGPTFRGRHIHPMRGTVITLL